MADRPLVSILAACYNHEKFIGDFVQSVMDQTYENIELIICDDCSRDASYEVLMSYKEQLEGRLPHVEILKNETNQGVTKNFNRLVKASRGEIVKIVASDDFFAPDAVSAVVDYFGKNPKARAAVVNGNKIKEGSTYSEKELLGKIYETAPDFNPDTLLRRTFECNIISAPCTFLRKNVFDEFGLYDEDFAIEDLEYWFRLISKGVEFEFIDEELLFYRINENSITSTEANEALARRKTFFHKNEMGILEKYRNSIPAADYAKIIINRNIAELYFAAAHGLEEYKQEIKQELDSFDGWKDTDLAFKAKAKARILKCRG